MSNDYLLLEKDKEKRIAWITFNNPDKLNMVTFDEMGEFCALLEQLENDDDVKVLVLKGAGDCFGSGGNIMMTGTETVGFSRDAKASRPSVRARLLKERAWSDISDKTGITKLGHFMKPSVCQVHGYCYGWHLQVATGADIVVASEDALFAHPAFRYICGEAPVGVWLSIMGRKRFLEMLYTGRPFTAHEMEQCGFVNRVVSKESLEAEVNELASAIALKPIELLMIDKYFVDTISAMQHETFAPNMVGAMAHNLSTHMKTEPTDFVVLKETSNKGAKGAINSLDDRYPPKYRLSYSGREKQKQPDEEE